MRGSRRGWVGSRGKTKLILIVNLPKKKMPSGGEGANLIISRTPSGKISEYAHVYLTTPSK